MKALILNNKVVQVEAQEFPVAPSLEWIEAIDGVMPGWGYRDGEFIEPDPIEESIDETPSIKEQLDALFDYAVREDNAKLLEIDSKRSK